MRMRDALRGRTARADEIMGWLQDAMRLLCDHGVADKLNWCTPSGFPFRGNLYYGHSKHKVKTTVDGHTHTMTLATSDTRKFDRKAAVSAIAANFLHSLDAAALQLAVCEAKSHGVTDTLGIHDAVGGLASDIDVNADAMRLGFIECPAADPLEGFRDEVLRVLPNDQARKLCARCLTVKSLM